MAGKELPAQEVEAVLARRAAKIAPKPMKKQPGVLGVYQKLAVSAMKGGYMEV